MHDGVHALEVGGVEGAVARVPADLAGAHAVLADHAPHGVAAALEQRRELGAHEPRGAGDRHRAGPDGGEPGVEGEVIADLPGAEGEQALHAALEGGAHGSVPLEAGGQLDLDRVGETGGGGIRRVGGDRVLVPPGAPRPADLLVHEAAARVGVGVAEHPGGPQRQGGGAHVGTDHPSRTHAARGGVVDRGDPGRGQAHEGAGPLMPGEHLGVLALDAMRGDDPHGGPLPVGSPRSYRRPWGAGPVRSRLSRHPAIRGLPSWRA